MQTNQALRNEGYQHAVGAGKAVLYGASQVAVWAIVGATLVLGLGMVLLMSAVASDPKGSMYRSNYEAAAAHALEAD